MKGKYKLALFGAFDDDTLLGGKDNDTLIGDSEEAGLAGSYHGADTLYGEEGDDTLMGNGGADTLSGGDGDDVLFGDNRSAGLVPLKRCRLREPDPLGEEPAGRRAHNLLVQVGAHVAPPADSRMATTPCPAAACRSHERRRAALKAFAPPWGEDALRHGM